MNKNQLINELKNLNSIINDLERDLDQLNEEFSIQVRQKKELRDKVNELSRDKDTFRLALVALIGEK